MNKIKNITKHQSEVKHLSPPFHFYYPVSLGWRCKNVVKCTSLTLSLLNDIISMRQPGEEGKEELSYWADGNQLCVCILAQIVVLWGREGWRRRRRQSLALLNSQGVLEDFAGLASFCEVCPIWVQTSIKGAGGSVPGSDSVSVRRNAARCSAKVSTSWLCPDFLHSALCLLHTIISPFILILRGNSADHRPCSSVWVRLTDNVVCVSRAW